MIIGVIGAGRVGAVLAAALEAAGHDVIAVSGVSSATKRRLEELVPRARSLPPDQVALAAEDLLVISVPDDVLGGVPAGRGHAERCTDPQASALSRQQPGEAARPGIAAGLAAMGAIRPGQIVAHTSGAHGLEVLRPATERGARPLALHPAMTFTGTVADLGRLRGISYGVTAPDDLREIASRLVSDLGGTAEWIADDKRPLYHASLAHGANHLVTLVNEAADRLRDAGVVQPEKVLGPLLEAALQNALKMGDNALTGPVSRGDAGTVARHVEVLAGSGSLPAYLALARRTADRAIASGRLRATDAEALLDVLVSQQTAGAPS